VHLWRDYSCLAFWNGREVTRLAPMGRPLKRGEWYHLAVADAKGKLTVYLDALPCKVLSGGSGFTLGAKGLPLLVGTANAGGGMEDFQGLIDEIAVYSRVLSLEAVAEHMDAMGAKERIDYKEIQARLARERAAREAAARERLAELMDPEALYARGETRVYEGEHLTAISLPVGGIGTGSLQIDGRGVRHVWQIFNNMNQASVPHSFVAIRVQPQGAEPVLRALQTEAVGPFAAMEALRFRGEYPFGWFTFTDPALAVEVSLETFNPLIPLELRDSAIPCAITTVTVKNGGPKRAEIAVLATQQNAVGFPGAPAIQGRAHPGYGGNRNRIVRRQDATFLTMTSEGDETGSMTLATPAQPVIGVPSWETLEQLVGRLADEERVDRKPEAGPSPKGETLDGALIAPFALKPGEQRAVTFVLTWHFPAGRHGRGAWGGAGNQYANWWKNAAEVAQEVVRRRDELREKTLRFHDALYASNLPHWLLDRLSSQIAVLRSQTTFWTRSGYFGGWEGTCRESGCCHGNCNHVWHYAQAHARLFPALARRMREQGLRYMTDDGAIPHRQPRSHPAFDGQCGDILGAWREHLMSPDGSWLAEHWPRIQKAMDYVVARWDEDHDGVLAGPQWNTLDGNLGGSTSWLGTLYLAALAASEQMALLTDDAEAAARYRKIIDSGAKKQDTTLFNGDYYIQIPDPKPQQDYGTGCHIDQVLGQWWAHQLDLGWLYPPDHVRTALGSLFEHNFRPLLKGHRQAPRKFVADEDPGMQMITWPREDRPARHMRYADEVMSGFEYAAAAAMVQAGLMREGFTVVHAAAIRYNGRKRTGLTGANTASWGYSGNPFGDDECGKFYARPMSIWSMLLACQGYVYDGPAGRIGFRPVWRPEDHASFFTAAEGWGLFTQTREGTTQTERLEVRYGRLRAKTLVFALPEGAKPTSVAVTVADKAVAATHELHGREITIALPARTTVAEGQALAVTIAW
ncbi:MAG: GH116 family glycosyl-hydrolase, partial [Planctomycetota bacterium]